MSDVAIRVNHLSKEFRIGKSQGKFRYKSLRDSIASGVAAPFRRAAGMVRGNAYAASDLQESFWALKDVSFEVKQGEAVGIIGRNGAGKSTLLKVLSEITEPTEGTVELHGRVASLLEVGTGFHPELTGRDNIYLNGAILGMKRAEINRKFDEIVDFAEVEKFIDTPVKHYSSGMYVRLAFAVAAHLEPEILVVDEVLAVGDAAFQKKCLGKMGDVAKGGRTVFFVSHNLHAVSTLTAKVILLENGRRTFYGDTYEGLNHYRETWEQQDQEGYVETNKKTGVIRASVITSGDAQIHNFGKPLVFEFDVKFENKPQHGAFSFQIVDEEMKPIVYCWLFHSDQAWAKEGITRLRCVLTSPHLYMGRYSLVTWLGDRASNQMFESLKCICPFQIIMDGIIHDYGWQSGVCTYLEDTEWIVS